MNGKRRPGRRSEEVTMNRGLAGFLAAACLALVLSGCGDGPDAEIDALVRGDWRLRMMGAYARQMPVAPPGTITMTIGEDGRISGNGGVNTYGGTCSARPCGTFRVSAMYMTEMASMDPAMNEQEATFMATLSEMARWSVDDNVLSLTDSEGALGMTFDR